jgi:hypothetical protein
VIYTSAETSTGTKKCEFFPKTVILKLIIAYAITITSKNYDRPKTTRECGIF